LHFGAFLAGNSADTNLHFLTILYRILWLFGLKNFSAFSITAALQHADGS
jgi:hypothetical protein